MRDDSGQVLCARERMQVAAVNMQRVSIQATDNHNFHNSIDDAEALCPVSLHGLPSLGASNDVRKSIQSSSYRSKLLQETRRLSAAEVPLLRETRAETVHSAADTQPTAVALSRANVA